MPVTVAIDAMGGDHAPSVAVEGAVAAARSGEVRVVLVGPEDVVRAELARHDTDGLPLSVVHAPEVIEMGEAPAVVLRSKPRSSIHVGLGLQKAGAVDAFVSAGNTGAVMAAALFILGRAPGVARPTLPSVYPTVKGCCLLLDVGSNVDCRPEHLVQFARMGAVYAERVLHVASPSVALLNIGEEPGKGNEQAKATYDLLAVAQGLRFTGNIEGRDLMHHAADVVVCDGFVGNIVLKLGESLTTVLPALIGAAAQRMGLSADVQATLGALLNEVKRPFDYQNFGGSPLLGVAGTALIGHGSSSVRAIERLIHGGRRDGPRRRHRRDCRGDGRPSGRVAARTRGRGRVPGADLAPGRCVPCGSPTPQLPSGCALLF